MLVAHEETFGPITPLIRFSDEADAIRMANDTEFGLASYLFSSDASRIWRVAAAIEAGMVGINTGMISNEIAPSAASSSRASAGRGRSTGSTNTWRLKYLAWENGADRES